MTLNSERYLLINDADKLGKFQIHHGGERDNLKNSSLRPVFKVDERKAHTEYYFTSGYLDEDGKIYDCPLSIFYVQISKIHSFMDDEQYRNIKSDVIVFSKDFQNRKKLNIHLKSYYLGRGVYSETSVNGIVNLLNNYIDRNNELSSLNDQSFEFGNKRSGSLTQKEIVKIIDNLKFDFFSNDESRVGKDTNMWQEIELRNLSKNKFLNSKFKKILSESTIINWLSEESDHILIRYNGDSGFVKANGREVSSDPRKEKEIKDYLKMNINLHYDKLSDNIMSLKL